MLAKRAKPSFRRLDEGRLLPLEEFAMASDCEERDDIVAAETRTSRAAPCQAAALLNTNH
jgi:hypothetical protein